MRGTILIAILSHMMGAAQPVSPIDLMWRDYETTCNATFMITGFHHHVAESALFHNKAKVLQADLRRFTTVTCPKNLERVNGERSYAAIVPEFTRLSEHSVALHNVAKKQTGYIVTTYNAMSRDFGALKFDFQGMKCGRAMRESLGVIQKEDALILRGIEEMKACPALAKLETRQGATSGVRRSYGASGGAMVPSGKSRNGTSDITGTEKKPEKLPR